MTMLIFNSFFGTALCFWVLVLIAYRNHLKRREIIISAQAITTGSDAKCFCRVLPKRDEIDKINHITTCIFDMLEYSDKYSLDDYNIDGLYEMLEVLNRYRHIQAGLD